MPNIARRTILQGGLGLVGLAVAGRPAAAASFPDHQITVVCPFAPGGINDLCARVVAKGLEKTFKQNAVVENKPGASSILGMATIARSPPDGHTLVTCSDRIVCFPTIGATPFDIEKDFAPVTRLVVVPMFLVTRKGLGVKTIDELTALAKSNPNLTFASTGSGSTSDRIAIQGEGEGQSRPRSLQGIDAGDQRRRRRTCRYNVRRSWDCGFVHRLRSCECDCGCERAPLDALS